jgi:hypothetical protein
VIKIGARPGITIHRLKSEDSCADSDLAAEAWRIVYDTIIGVLAVGI